MTSSGAIDRRDLTAAGVVETVRLTTSGEVTAVEVVEASPGADRRARPGPERVLAWCWPTRPGPRRPSGTAALAARRAARAAARRTGGDQGGDRRRRLRDDVRRPRATRTPVAARRRGRPPAPRRPARSIVGKTRMPEFGRAPTPSPVARGITRNPWDREPHPRRLQRRVRRPRSRRAWCRSAIGGDGGGSIRIPSACCGLFGLKPTARPGHHRAARRTCGGRSARPAR